MPARMPGEPVFVSFLWRRVPQEFVDRIIPDGSEVRLYRRLAGQLDLVTDFATFGIKPASPEDERRLDEVEAAGSSCVTVTAHPARPKPPAPTAPPRRRTGSPHPPASPAGEPFTLRV
ncbi:hypothetical protein ACFC1B_28685, partial [Streptomyces xiamenensis]